MDMKHNFGYRVKLNAMHMHAFVEKYATYFETLEIKVNEETVYKIGMNNMLQTLSLTGIDCYSFHLPKKTFYSLTDFNITTDALNDIWGNRKIKLVTHFYDACEVKREYVNCVLNETLRRNNILLIENVETVENLFEYLNSLKSFARHHNIQVCLDIGHLMYSAYKCQINPEDVFSFFCYDVWWVENVTEIHIHDFISEMCHLNIGSGIMNYSVVKSLIKLLKNAHTIILETSVDDLSIQGIKEVNELKGRLGE